MRLSRDVYAGPLGRVYSAYIRRPILGRLVGRLVWGAEFAPLYAGLQELSTLPEDASVLDVACGSGLPLGWLDPHRRRFYLGVDTSPAMLARARRVARRRGFERAWLVRGDACALPTADHAADVVLLYNSLQAVDDPEAVVGEAARCLAGGGTLLGSMLVRGGSARGDAMLARAATGAHAVAGPGGTSADLTRWLTEAGLRDVEVTAPDTLAMFRARAHP